MAKTGNNLNEVMGIPDHDNVERLINKIIERINLGLRTYVYEKNEYDEFSFFDGIVKDSFYLNGDLHCCDWLSDDTLLTYTCDFDSNAPYVKAIFKPIENLSHVYVTKNGDRIIRNSQIDLAFSFGTNFSISDVSYINGVRDKIKALLRHELEHAYGELYKQENFQIKYEDPDIDDKIVSESDFVKEYKNITNKLLKLNKIKQPRLYGFLSSLYLINYLEINANVTSFYQRLIDDYDSSGNIKDIEEYYEYINYKNAIDYIMHFSDQFMFDQYKEDIQLMYGKHITGIHKLQATMKAKYERFLKKIKKLYKNLSKVIANKSGRINVKNHDKLKKAYNESKLSLLRRDYNDLSESERVVLECVASHYLDTRADSYLTLIDILFGPLKNKENYVKNNRK